LARFIKRESRWPIHDRPACRAFDVTELALKAQVDDGIDIGRLEILGMDIGVFAFDTVVVDGVE